MLAEELFHCLDLGEQPVGQIPVGKIAASARRTFGGRHEIEHRQADHGDDKCGAIF